MHPGGYLAQLSIIFLPLNKKQFAAHNEIYYFLSSALRFIYYSNVLYDIIIILLLLLLFSCVSELFLSCGELFS